MEDNLIKISLILKRFQNKRFDIYLKMILLILILQVG